MQSQNPLWLAMAMLHPAVQVWHFSIAHHGLYCTRCHLSASSWQSGLCGSRLRRSSLTAGRHLIVLSSWARVLAGRITVGDLGIAACTLAVCCLQSAAKQATSPRSSLAGCRSCLQTGSSDPACVLKPVPRSCCMVLKGAVTTAGLHAGAARPPAGCSAGSPRHARGHHTARHASSNTGFRGGLGCRLCAGSPAGPPV